MSTRLALGYSASETTIEANTKFSSSAGRQQHVVGFSFIKLDASRFLHPSSYSSRLSSRFSLIGAEVLRFAHFLPAPASSTSFVRHPAHQDRSKPEEALEIRTARPWLWPLPLPPHSQLFWSTHGRREDRFFSVLKGGEDRRSDVDFRFSVEEGDALAGSQQTTINSSPSSSLPSTNQPQQLSQSG